MITFDADIASEWTFGNVDVVNRATAIPVEEQSLPIVVVEEILRGRLSIIRSAESGRGRTAIDQAYALLQQSIAFIREFAILPYTDTAEQLFRTWRIQKIRIGTHDLRIAAIAVAHSATLVSRNRTDFDLIPNLHVEYWGR
jgi:tRNA(fMet)-specific endonuclease VapC